MIFFITNKDDITTDILINKLNKKEAPYYRLNTEDLIDSHECVLNFSNCTFQLFSGTKKLFINFDEIRSVYFRRPQIPALQKLDVSEIEKTYLKKESVYLLQGIYDLLESKYWINDYWSIKRAESKILQLKVAKKLGFKIPKTLLTNNVEAAEKFLCQHECIIKPIKSGAIGDDERSKVIFTNLITPSKLDISRVRLFPVLLQRHVKKEADIRVTVVGKRFVVAKIKSQETDNTKIDWRAGDSINLEYERIRLPISLEDKCLRLMDSLGLSYGAIDFILEPTGDFTFLEINPNGQWGWIENRLNIPISDYIIELLLNGNENL